MTLDPQRLASAIEFRVSGLPQPKGSTRSFNHNKSGKVVTWASNRGPLKEWEGCVRAAALKVRRRDRFYGPVGLTVWFYLRRPTSVSVHKRPHPHVKPDLSKLLRGIEDALTGVLYNDDAQIVTVQTAKRYCDEPGALPGAVVTLYPLEGGR